MRCPQWECAGTFPEYWFFSLTTYAGIGIKHIHTVPEIARLKDILHHT
jgi:hypothetical protein